MHHLLKRIITGICVVMSFTVEANFNDSTIGSNYSKQQLIADVAYMCKAMENVHPNLYHSITREEFRKVTDNIRASFKDSMTITEAWPYFAKIVGAINEGHTSISFPDAFLNKLGADKILLFPIPIKEFDGEHLLVRFDVSDEQLLQPGDKIISINGIPAKSLVKQLSEGIGGLSSWKATQVARQIITFMAAYNISPPYTITYLRNNEIKKTTITPLVLSKLRERIAEKRKVLDAEPVTASYWFKKLDNEIGYINFISMRDREKFKFFLDSVFTDIGKNPIKGLIVDVRQNGGGNSSLGNDLLHYITDKPFRMSGGVKWKISQEYKDYYTSLDSSQQFMGSVNSATYFTKVNGEFLEYPASQPETTGENPLRYKGKVCFLIGPNTFSSANMLINAVTDYRLAISIGEATGESPNDYGELISLKLPNTGISFFTSTKQFIRANGDTKNNDPVLPDFIVKDNPATPSDEVLEFAKKWISSDRK